MAVEPFCCSSLTQLLPGPPRPEALGVGGVPFAGSISIPAPWWQGLEPGPPCRAPTSSSVRRWTRHLRAESHYPRTTPGPGLANWSPFCKGGRPRVGWGREFIWGSGTSGVQGPACRHQAHRRSHRQPEERPRLRLAAPQTPRLIINWEGLAPRRTCCRPRRLGIPAGGCTRPTRRSTSTEHLLFAWPGIPSLNGGGNKDEQGTHGPAGDSTHRSWR